MNFTQVNYLMDEVMPDVKPATFKIISIIARQTWGWKGRSSVVLSYTDLKNLTGIGSVNTIKAAICEALKYIEQVEKEGQGFEYSMKPIGQSVSEIDTVEAESISKIDTLKTGTVSEIDTVLCQKLTESVSKIDTATSGSKEKKEINKRTREDVALIALFEGMTGFTPPHDTTDMYAEEWLAPTRSILSQSRDFAEAEKRLTYAIIHLRKIRYTIKSPKSLLVTALNWYPDAIAGEKSNGTNGYAAHAGVTNQDGSFY